MLDIVKHEKMYMLRCREIAQKFCRYLHLYEYPPLSIPSLQNKISFDRISFEKLNYWYRLCFEFDGPKSPINSFFLKYHEVNYITHKLQHKSMQYPSYYDQFMRLTTYLKKHTAESLMIILEYSDPQKINSYGVFSTENNS